MPELEDWLRGLAMLGKYGTDYVVLAVDAAGQLYALARGEDGTGTLRTLAVDSAGQLIMVPRGSGGNYLDVDAAGFLTTVMKGDYEGALRTIKLDDEGRMSAFVIDSVDAWGNMLSIGNAELAARLGSPVIYEQAGRVQFFETFENGLQRWSQDTSGNGASIDLDPTFCKSGGYSCKLTGGSTLTWQAKITYAQGTLPVGKIGLAFALSSVGEFDRVEFWLYAYNGANLHLIGGKLDDVGNDLEIYDDASSWQDVGNADPSSNNPRLFYFVKVVADVSAGVYDSLRFNQQEIDISAHAIWTTADATPPRVDIVIALYSNSGDNDIVYVDDVIFTVAEP